MEERTPTPLGRNQITKADIWICERLVKVHRKNDRIWPARTQKSPHRQINWKKHSGLVLQLVHSGLVLQLSYTNTSLTLHNHFYKNKVTISFSFSEQFKLVKAFKNSFQTSQSYRESPDIVATLYITRFHDFTLELSDFKFNGIMLKK